MKPRVITAILLFISGYSPLFAILAIKDFDFDKKHELQHPAVVFSMLGVSLLSVVLLFVTMRSIKRGIAVRVVSVKNRSVDIINYSIPYVVSFLGIDFAKPADVLSLGVFLLIMLLLTITSKSIFINPILALANYGLYDLEYEWEGKNGSTTILSQTDLKRGQNCTMRSLTPYLYIITETSE